MGTSFKKQLRQSIQQRVAAVREQITQIRSAPARKPSKRVYRCGNCQSFGHNARTCPKRRGRS